MRARPVLAVAMASSVTALVKPLSTRAAVLAQVPKLVDLAAACGWDFYGPQEWTFLADAACDSGWIVEADDGKLLGCLFRADRGRGGAGLDVVRRPRAARKSRPLPRAHAPDARLGV